MLKRLLFLYLGHIVPFFISMKIGELIAPLIKPFMDNSYDILMVIFILFLLIQILLIHLTKRFF